MTSGVQVSQQPALDVDLRTDSLSGKMYAWENDMLTFVSGVQSPCLKVPIGMAYVASKYQKAGSELLVDVRGKMQVATPALPCFPPSCSCSFSCSCSCSCSFSSCSCSGVYLAGAATRTHTRRHGTWSYTELPRHLSAAALDCHQDAVHRGELLPRCMRTKVPSTRPTVRSNDNNDLVLCARLIAVLVERYGRISRYRDPYTVH